MRARGFTVVELIITITIMGILLILTVVGVNTTQMKARDDERIADVEAIQQHLEIFFTNGADFSVYLGRYPTTDLTLDAATMKNFLRDIDTKSLTAPGIADPTLTFKSATNNVQTTSGVLPQPTKDQYVYQPLQPDGSLCGSGVVDCRKYNLYYRLEETNTVYMVTSKNQ